MSSVGAASADAVDAPPAPPRVQGELRTRLLTALILIPVLLAAVAVGGRVFLAGIVLLAGVGTWEFLAMAAHKPIPGRRLPGVALAMAIPIVLYRGGGDDLVTLLVAGAVGIALVQLLTDGPRDAIGAVSVTLFGAVYVGLLFAHFVLVRELLSGAPGSPAWAGAVLLGMPLVLTWTNDTAAYAVGRRWGRRRLAPSVSPGKSLEGAVGALFATVAVAVPAALLVQRWLPGMDAVDGVALGVLVGVAAPCGDLVESSFKRDAGVKDSSRLIPGHGGVLDRFDSLLLSVPAFYYYVRGVVL